MYSRRGLLFHHRTFTIGINFTSLTPLKMFDPDSDSEIPLLREPAVDCLAGADLNVGGKAAEISVTEEERPDTSSSAEISESNDSSRPSQTGSAVTVRRWSASAATGPPIIRDKSSRDGADSQASRGVTFEDFTAKDESAGDSPTAVDTLTAQVGESAGELGSSSIDPSGSGTPPSRVTFWGSPSSSDFENDTGDDSKLKTAGLMLP